MPWDYSSPRTVRPGDRVRIELPYSEVCMHMRVAGQVMAVRMTDGRYPMAQLLNSDGSEFSFPITTGEAGIYGDVERGFYYYPEKEQHNRDTRTSTTCWRRRRARTRSSIRTSVERGLHSGRRRYELRPARLLLGHARGRHRHPGGGRLRPGSLPPTAALGDLGHFIRDNGGPELWDEIDQYEVGSCWLRHGPGTEISYNARLDRVVEPPLGTAPRAASRTPAMLTWGRLNAATLGGLSRTPQER